MTLPVSVVVTAIPSRRWFLERHCLPSVAANHPAEVLVEAGRGSAAEKRNRGAARATAPYLLFVDDDDELGPTCLSTLLDVLEKEPGCGFSYCDHRRRVWPGVGYPSLRRQFLVRGRPFDAEVLRRVNYISNTSLMRRALFPGYDPSLSRFLDWDLWLRMAARGIAGRYVPLPLFTANIIDDGMTASVRPGPAYRAIRRRHQLRWFQVDWPKWVERGVIIGQRRLTSVIRDRAGRPGDPAAPPGGERAPSSVPPRTGTPRGGPLRDT
jgi:hypothetical protein